MNVRSDQNLSMLCDFYELTMGNGYFRNGYKDRITYFDLFFRQVPDGGGFAIAAGLEQVVEYITNLHFSDEDIEYLRSRNIFCEEFLQYLRNFRLRLVRVQPQVLQPLKSHILTSRICYYSVALLW